MPPPNRMLLLVAQPVEGGVPRHVTDLLSGVLEADWHVEVMCPESSSLWAAARALGVSTHAMPDRRAPSLGDLATVRRLVPVLRRASVVHAHSSKAGAVVRLAARLVGRSSRTVFTPHGWSFWAFPAFRSIEKFAASRGGTIITVSENERDAGLAAGVGQRAQYRVIPNGVDTTHFAPVPPAEGDHLVMVARLARPRRPDLAIRGLGELRRHRPGVTLELVGDGPLRPEMEALAASLNLADAVRFAGARSETRPHVHASACVLHASDYEGASLAVLEAMAMGRGVVASRIGGMDELVVDKVTGRLCGDDPAEWAAAIGDVLDRRRQYGEAARARTEEQFDIRSMVAATLSVYEELLNHVK